MRALVGFTRLDAPDPDDPELVTRAPLARDGPTWVPASEVRGEGIFLRIPEDVLTEWEQRVEDTTEVRSHYDAYVRFRGNRYSDRLRGAFDPTKGWPGARYLALHTLSHLLIRTIALECGYNSASLSERIYTSHDDDPRAGILIYTAVPDAEGTLGGLVSLAEPEPLTRLVRRALREARHCSSDPLCAERLPEAPADFLHGAACHVCLFVSETTCERGNRFLDRRFVVPLDVDDRLALYPQLP
ncbi:DrmB family protein [Cryptosporangium sp. NPDC048952]|uniref:DrmB family protein n=1 Tax=Cryptosporangium sp. NPDC048952 TaxID=3363961 RepID=UPI00371DC432